MNIISILIGLVALFWGVIAFTPFLGWMYWGVLPVAIVGLAPVPAPAPAPTSEPSAEPKPTPRGFLGLFGRRAA